MAAQDQKLVPLPEGLNFAQWRRIKGLAQYKGRSVEGNKRSLGNLPRKNKMPQEDIKVNPSIPDGMPSPNIPRTVPQVPSLKTIQAKFARRVMSQQENDLFLETWVEWLTAHPEWTTPEDLDDLQTICMETVFMFRLQQAQREKPAIDNSEAYNQSYKRKQSARQNLTARRVDKVGTKAGGNTTNNLNIAILAGEVTPEMQAERKRKMIQKKNDEDLFLEGTVISSVPVIAEPQEES